MSMTAGETLIIIALGLISVMQLFTVLEKWVMSLGVRRDD
jgi:hypothetical protein